MADRRGCRGQATIELLVVLPVVLLLGAVMLQLLGVGKAYAAADGAAEAGALALAAGLPAEPAVRASLSGWPRDRVTVREDGGRVRVHIKTRTLAGIGGVEVSGSAWALEPGAP